LLYLTVGGIWLGLGLIAIAMGLDSEDKIFMTITSTWLLVTLVPMIAAGIRRLHDTGRSGFWILIYMIPLIGWLALMVRWAEDGQRGPNRFGPDPKV
jgi:uncharacterized membrane protein YhaH (DUF805 family)